MMIAAREPFDWDGLIGFLQPRAIAGVEWVSGEGYRRTVNMAGVPAVIGVSRVAEGVSLSVPESQRLFADEIAERVGRMFDVAADPVAIGNHLKKDRMLQPLVKRWPGIRVPGAWDPFELAVRAIVGQQVSVRGATTIIGRIAESYGTPMKDGHEALRRLFPAPERLAAAEITGMPHSRAATIRAVAEAFAAGRVDAARLGALRGVGPWTLNYIAMRAWRDPDAFPAADLGLRKAAGNLTERELATRAERWRPWRAYAAMLLWRSL